MKKFSVFVFFMIINTLAAGAESDESVVSFLKDIEIAVKGGDYAAPRISPDGEKLAFTTEKYDGIFLIEAGGALYRLTDEQFAGWRFEWGPDSEEIYYRMREKGKYALKKVDLRGKRESLTGLMDEISFPSVVQQDILYHKGDSDVEVMSVKSGEDTGEKTPVGSKGPYAFMKNDRIYYMDEGTIYAVLDKEQRCFYPVMSPDGRKVCYKKLGGGIYLFDADIGESRLIGPGNHPRWSRDGKYVIFDHPVDDGHRIVNSELYLYDVGASLLHKLTETGEMIERFPEMGKDNMVYFSSGGSIYKARIDPLHLSRSR